MADNYNLVDVDVRNITDIMSQLRTTTKENRKALKRAFARAGSIMRTAVRKGSRKILTRNLKERQKGIYVRTYYKDMSGVIVGINKVIRLPSESNRKFSLQWVELPTKETMGRNKRLHGATPAHPFFRTSVEPAVTKAQDAVSDEIMKQLEKIASKRK